MKALQNRNKANFNASIHRGAINIYYFILDCYWHLLFSKCSVQVH